MYGPLPKQQISAADSVWSATRTTNHCSGKCLYSSPLPEQQISAEEEYSLQTKQNEVLLCGFSIFAQVDQVRVKLSWAKHSLR